MMNTDVVKNIAKGASTIICSIAFSACVQLGPVPNYARSGDTIVLGIGGIQRNTSGEQNLQSSDLVVTLTDSANVTYTLPTQYPFKAYPDYSSLMNFQTVGRTTVMAPLPIQAFDGGWFVPVMLTQAGGTTALPNLALGSATISVTSPTVTLVNTPSTGGFASEGNLLSIPVEIIAGQTNPGGTASVNFKRQFQAYSTNQVKSFNIAPSSLAGVTTVGALQVAIKYDPTYYSAAIDPIVVPYSHNPSINLQQNIVANGDGTKTINILLTAPKGFSSTPTPLIPALRDLNLRVMYFGSKTGFNITNDFQIMSSKLIDTNGSTIPGLGAVVGPMVL